MFIGRFSFQAESCVRFNTCVISLHHRSRDREIRRRYWSIPKY